MSFVFRYRVKDLLWGYIDPMLAELLAGFKDNKIMAELLDIFRNAGILPPVKEKNGAFVSTYYLNLSLSINLLCLYALFFLLINFPSNPCLSVHQSLGD